MLELAARQSQLEQAVSKLSSLVLTILIFGILVALAFWLAERSSERVQRYVKYLVFLAPALAFLFIGLIGPALRTLYLSFRDARGDSFVGLENYHWAFTQPEILDVLKNTGIWMVVAPIASTGFGLTIAVLTDRMYNRDPDGQFASVNTLVPQLEHTGRRYITKNSRKAFNIMARNVDTTSQ